MSQDKQKALVELTRRGPFWICFIVFALLACDYGYRFANLMAQRAQLNDAMLNQARNYGALAQSQELEKRIEALSLELLQIATTNTRARQIVQDFNIQWTPAAPATSAPTAAPPSAK